MFGSHMAKEGTKMRTMNGQGFAVLEEDPTSDSSGDPTRTSSAESTSWHSIDLLLSLNNRITFSTKSTVLAYQTLPHWPYLTVVSPITYPYSCRFPCCRSVWYDVEWPRSIITTVQYYDLLSWTYNNFFIILYSSYSGSIPPPFTMLIIGFVL